MEMTYKQIFNESPKKYKTPLEKGDHPEIDESELMDEEGTTKYQLLIGQCQWLVTLGRVDVCWSAVGLGPSHSRTPSKECSSHNEQYQRLTLETIKDHILGNIAKIVCFQEVQEELKSIDITWDSKPPIKAKEADEP